MKNMSSGNMSKVPVFISVYVMKPRKLKNSERQHRNHHNHHHHHHIHHLHHHARGGGYDRKAELLQYCQQMRVTARGDQQTPSSSSSAPKTTPKFTTNTIVPLRRITGAGRKKQPSCFGDWKKLLLPSCSLTTPFTFNPMKREKKSRSNSNSESKMMNIEYSLLKNMHSITRSLKWKERKGFGKKFLETIKGRK